MSPKKTKSKSSTAKPHLKGAKSSPSRVVESSSRQPNDGDSRGNARGNERVVHIPEILNSNDQNQKKLKPSRKVEDSENDDEAVEDWEIEDEQESEIYQANPKNQSAIEIYQSPKNKDTVPLENEEEPEVSATGLTSSDPLKQYLADIRKYPLLPPEQEYALAIRLSQSGDLNAAKALVQANLRLVVKIAMDYRSYYSNLMDLIQEGNIGLMKAVSKFDPTKGARLGYYASWWIKSYILKYLLDNFRLVKIGTTQAQKKLFYHLMREKERLESQGLLAGPKLLAEKLQVREKDVVEMQSRLSSGGSELSLDAPVHSDSEKKSTHLETLVDSQESPDETLLREQLIGRIKKKIPKFITTLTDKERRVFEDRMMADNPKTLQEVADHYGLTRERARQIETKVLSKLRDFMKADLETGEIP